MSPVAVTLADGLPSEINFNTMLPDANGIFWYIQTMEGWDSSAVRHEVQTVTGKHGGYLAAAFLEPREITLQGVVKTPSETAFWLAYNQLDAAIANLFTPYWLVVTEGSTQKYVSVVRGGSVRKEFIGTGSIGFEIPLVAVDPLKYSYVLHSQTVPGTLVNAGNFETDIELTAIGSGTMTSTNTTQGAGATISLTDVAVGDILETNRRLFVDSSFNHKYASVGAGTVWWKLLPGSNVITGSSFTAKWRDAWL